VISTQKQPGCKKSAAPLKIASMKKAVKSKETAKKWLWWHRLMAKILITIQVNLYWFLVKLGWGYLTWIVVIKIFAINLNHHSHFLAAPLISQLFYTGYFEQDAFFFYSQAVFEQIIFTNTLVWQLVDLYNH